MHVCMHVCVHARALYLGLLRVLDLLREEEVPALLELAGLLALLVNEDLGSTDHATDHNG